MFVTLFQQAGLISDTDTRNYMGQYPMYGFAGLAHQGRRTKNILVVSLASPHEIGLVTAVLIRSVTRSQNPDGKQNHRGVFRNTTVVHTATLLWINNGGSPRSANGSIYQLSNEQFLG